MTEPLFVFICRPTEKYVDFVEYVLQELSSKNKHHSNIFISISVFSIALEKY